MEKYFANISACYLCNAGNEIPKMVKYTAPVECIKMDQEWYPSRAGIQEVKKLQCSNVTSLLFPGDLGGGAGFQLTSA